MATAARRRTDPSYRRSSKASSPCQASAVSFPTTAARPSPLGWIVTTRGANALRIAWNRGFSRPSPSMAAHEVTGQQSLSCQTTAPAVFGACER